MPNGQRRNRNSRHANTQRNLQTASVIEASAIAEIAEVVVAAEEYVDNSAEIERLKSSLESLDRKFSRTSTRQQKEICELKKKEKLALLSIDSYTATLKSLRDDEGVICIKESRNGSILEIVPKCLERGGEEVNFKDVPKLLDELDGIILKDKEVIELQLKEMKKLKTFCKSLMIKNEEGIKNKQDDDLVCDINFSDEESDEEEEEEDFSDEESEEESDEEEEDFMSHKTFIQRGEHYSYNEKYELYDDDFQFIKKFDSKFKMMAHFKH